MTFVYPLLLLMRPNQELSMVVFDLEIGEDQQEINNYQNLNVFFPRKDRYTEIILNCPKLRHQCPPPPKGTCIHVVKKFQLLSDKFVLDL